MSNANENKYVMSKMFLKINQFIWQKSFMQYLRGIFYYIDAILLFFIKSKKPIKNNKKKVLIIYNLALGDGILFYEVSKSIRTIWPREEYEVSIACQKAFAPLYESSGLYDTIIPLDFAGSVINLKKRFELFRKLRTEMYDIVVDPVGCEDCTMNVFVTRASLGKRKIGVLDKTLKKHQMSNRMRKRIYDQVVLTDIPQVHLIQYYAEFFRQLGDTTCQARPANLPHVDLKMKLPDKFFIVFPVASMDVKKWNLHNYAKIIEKVYAETNMSLLVCGTEHDRESVDECLKLVSNVPVIDFIGKTNILQFTELIGRASLVITNDTSAYHIAVARNVPTVMICGGYTYDRYAHYQYKKFGYRDPVLVTHKMDCYNCNNHCKYHNFKVFPCIENISLQDAWNTIEKVIEEEHLK